MVGGPRCKDAMRWCCRSAFGSGQVQRAHTARTESKERSRRCSRRGRVHLGGLHQHRAVCRDARAAHQQGQTHRRRCQGGPQRRGGAPLPREPVPAGVHQRRCAGHQLQVAALRALSDLLLCTGWRAVGRPGDRHRDGVRPGHLQLPPSPTRQPSRPAASTGSQLGRQRWAISPPEPATAPACLTPA